jgi:hypothetical protein
MGGVTVGEKLHGVLRFKTALRGADLAAGFALIVAFFAAVLGAAAFLAAEGLALLAAFVPPLAVMPVFMASAATSLTAAAAMF